MQDIYSEFGGKAKLDSKLLSLEGNQDFLHQEISLFVSDL